MKLIPDRSKVVLRHILENRAEAHPDKDCIQFENGEKWTYMQALEQAYSAANVLAGCGVKRGDRVLIFLSQNGPDWIRAWWGIASLGAIFVPVNPAYKGEMLRHVCLDSVARHVVTSGDYAERIKGLGLDLQIIDPEALKVGSTIAPVLDSPIEPWDTHALMQTSGTTGKSKGVIYAYFQTYSQGTPYTKATPEDTTLIDLPIFHAAAMHHMYPFLSVGGKIVMVSNFSPSKYLDVIRTYGITSVVMLGFMAEILMSAPPKPDDADIPLEKILIAPLPKDPKAFMERFGIKDLISAYGATELCNFMINDDPIKHPGSCGRILDGFDVRLVDENDIPVPVGEVGELILRSDLPWRLNDGYWGRPEETVKAWLNGWFHTGDSMKCDEDGYYYFVDRKKDFIRRRGENIASFEVEREVVSFPDVKEAAAIAVPDGIGGDEVKVMVIPRDTSTFDPAALIHYLIPRMPYFMVPRYVETVSEFPKTATGRVKKQQLRDLGNSSATWDREAAGIVVNRNS